MAQALDFLELAFRRVERIAQGDIGVRVLWIGRMGTAHHDRRAGHLQRDMDVEQPALRGALVGLLDDHVTGRDARAELLVIRRAVIQELMCHEIIDCAALGGRFGIDFKRYFSRELERLQELQALGLTYVRSGCIGVTQAGRLLMRTVAMAFDAYLAPRTAAERFSKVI